MQNLAFNVLRTHHVEYLVTDLERAQAFTSMVLDSP